MFILNVPQRCSVGAIQSRGVSPRRVRADTARLRSENMTFIIANQ